jgi:dTDP-4-dehydrorhamnose reductase
LRVAADQRSNPTYAAELAWSTFELLGKDVAGVVHTVGAVAMTRPELGDLVGATFGFAARRFMEVAPTSALGQVAPRPLRASLSDAKLRRLLGRPLVAPAEGLARLKAELG